MGGLSFEEMNCWRMELKKQLLKAAEITGYQIQVINPVDYYNFEDMKNIILERYQELLAYYESFSALNTQQKMQLGAIRQILTSEKLLEKATILSTMQEIQKILSDICVRNRIPSHNIVAFGKNIEVDDRVNGISPENFRKMLFESTFCSFNKSRVCTSLPISLSLSLCRLRKDSHLSLSSTGNRRLLENTRSVSSKRPMPIAKSIVLSFCGKGLSVSNSSISTQ